MGRRLYMHSNESKTGNRFAPERQELSGIKALRFSTFSLYFVFPCCFLVIGNTSASIQRSQRIF